MTVGEKVSEGGKLLQFGQSELLGCELEVDILAELTVDRVLGLVPGIYKLGSLNFYIDTGTGMNTQYQIFSTTAGQ